MRIAKRTILISIAMLILLFGYSLTARLFAADYNKCVEKLAKDDSEKIDVKISPTIWHQYYQHFNIDYMSIRDEGHAKILQQPQKTNKAIILIHGLTDSTFSLTDLSKHFYQEGYDVYLPLLSHHGIKTIDSMNGVTLDAWKANVRYALDMLTNKYDKISIGGLSMGALLAFYSAAQYESINGAVYLFSAPFELKPQYPGVVGHIQELYVNNVPPKENKPLIDPANPYLYSRMDRYALRELVKLIKEVDVIAKDIIQNDTTLKNKVLAIHSESDKNAYVEAVKALSCKFKNNMFTTVIIPERYNVSHGSVVLNKTIYKTTGHTDEYIIEKKNPFFNNMTKYISGIDWR